MRAAWPVLHVGELLVVGEGLHTVYGVRATAVRAVAAVGTNGEWKVVRECGREVRGEGRYF